MAKSRTFSLTEENSQKISDFIESVKIVGEGILMGQNSVTFIYREKNDTGMTKDDIITAVSGELSKAQKQFVIQESLSRGYLAMVGYYTKKKDEIQAKYDGIINKINEITEIKDGKIKGTEFEYLTQQAIDIKNQYQKAKKEDKDKLLEQLHITNEKVKAVEPIVNETIEAYNLENTKLTKELAEISGELKGVSIKVEENEQFAKNAIEDRDHATEFINVTMAYIKEIEAMPE